MPRPGGDAAEAEQSDLEVTEEQAGMARPRQGRGGGVGQGRGLQNGAAWSRGSAPGESRDGRQGGGAGPVPPASSAPNDKPRWTHALHGSLAAGLLAMTLGAGAAAEPVALERWGSFHVGGREVVISGQPVREMAFNPGSVPVRIDPNGTYLMGSMYAQYMIPANPRGQAPLLMWHGGGLTGVTWETTPDGREGWQHFFLRRGWPVYVSDAVERGRSGWSMIPEQTGGQHVLLTQDNPWERFRIGDGAGSFARGTTNPGVQSPPTRRATATSSARWCRASPPPMR
ncbi:hypothetical protein ACFQU2_28505 [Siccirubricoccus deserti]